MAELAETLDSLHIGPQRRLQLVVVASTLMQNNHECVIAWSVQEQGLIRPITNLVINSWIFGTFKVGQVYWFVILDSNPSKAIWPNKSEDTIVQINPVPVNTVGTRPVPVRYTKSEMYNMLFGPSVRSVFNVFAPGVIHEGKYIIEGTECPSVGILQCNLSDIMMFKNPFNMSATRCWIFQVFDFPVKAQNQDALLKSLNGRPANAPVLVLLGLGRQFAGAGVNVYNPRRCHILVIGVIMQGGG